MPAADAISGCIIWAALDVQDRSLTRLASGACCSLAALLELVPTSSMAESGELVAGFLQNKSPRRTW